MTAKTIHWNGGRAEKMPGWHSWRHRTRGAQDRARENYKANRGPAARRRRAAERAERDRQADELAEALIREIFEQKD